MTYIAGSALTLAVLRAVFVAIVGSLAIAQAPPNYSPTEAAKHVGETAAVTGTVDGFHQSGKGNIFLNMPTPNAVFCCLALML
jgi:hypothetical protein